MIKGKCKLNIRSLRFRCFSNVFLTNNILTTHRNIAGYQRGRIKSDLQKFFEAKVTACYPVPPSPYRERPWAQCRSGWCWRHPGGSWRCCSNLRPRRKELTGLEFELQMWNHALQDKKHCHFVRNCITKRFWYLLISISLRKKIRKNNERHVTSLIKKINTGCSTNF